MCGATGAQEQRLREIAAAGLAQRNCPPEKVALAVMGGVLANKPVVPVNTEAWITYALSRFAPTPLTRMLREADKAMQRRGQHAAADQPVLGAEHR